MTEYADGWEDERPEPDETTSEPDAGAQDAPAGEMEDVEDEASTAYENAAQWLSEWLLNTWTRPTDPGSSMWCPQWWRHEEAIARIQAMWAAWEELRMSPGVGMSKWWRDHGDYHLGILHASDGPFNGCSPEKGHTQRPTKPLRVEEPPEGTFLHR